jgi:hypothetical protein
MNYRNVIMQGDALATLQSLPDGCVQCCVSSPPYYALLMIEEVQ